MNLAKSFAALTGASGVSMVAQLVRGKLAALLLGPAGIGVFNQLSLLWNLFNVAGGLGSFLGVVQHGTEALAAKDDVALRHLSSTFILFLGIVSCVLALLGALFSTQLSNLILHDGGSNAKLVALILLSVPLAVTAQTYHALLAAARAVRALVITQIVTDLGAVAVFAILIFPLGLRGAVVGFMATYVISLIAKGIAVRRLLGPRLIVARPREFSWAVLRSNVGYGASALIMVALTNVAVLIVSRIIIDRYGVEANGIFANGWRIASVYLGSVTATSFAYLLPTLGRCESAGEVSREVNSALRFYATTLPLLMAGVMAAGELVVWIILSRQFLPAAGLLLYFVPAELARIFSETLALTLLARRRVALYIGVSSIQALTFVASALALAPAFGLPGAALAYLVSHVAGLAANLIVAGLSFGVRPDASVQRQALITALMLGCVAMTTAHYAFGSVRFGVVALVCLAWVAATALDPSARDLIRRTLRRGAAA